MRRIVVAVVAFASAAALVAGFATSAAAPKKALTVRVITAGKVTVGTWDPANYRAYKAIAKKYGWQLQVAEAVPYGQAPQLFDRWGSQHIDVVISTDNGFQSSFLPAAAKYAKTKWVMMSDLSTTKLPSNVSAYTVDWCDAGFALGVAMAEISKTHTVAESAALPILPTSKAYAGMKVGAAATGIPTKVLIKFAGDFIDATKAAETASALMNQGADVLTAIVNGPVAAIAARIQAEHKWYVGSYADDSHYAPKSTVTSALFDFPLTYGIVGKELSTGKFSLGIHRFGLKQGFVKLLPFEHGFAAQGVKAQAVMKRASAGKFDGKLASCRALTK